MAEDFISVLRDRGFIHQMTDATELSVLSRARGLHPYVGFDLTAQHLHVGSLIQLMVLRWAMRFKLEPVVVLGEFTTRIGDPTGRKTARPMLNEGTISGNRNGIERDIRRVVYDDYGDITILSNVDWLEDVSLSEYLIDFAALFSVNKMLAQDSIKTRLDAQDSLSVLEFNYSLFQAMDFYFLNEEEGCNVQMGGSDQWGNIVAGVDLIRRKGGGAAYGITTPLMTNAAGEKMGKTAGGAIWLHEDGTSIDDFWQFWRNVEDVKVREFLLLFTELPIGEIDTLMAGDINVSKKRLATEVTRIVHSEEKARSAQARAEAMFEGSAFDNLEPILIYPPLVENTIINLVAHLMKSSKGEARRLCDQNAVRLDDEVMAGTTVLARVIREDVPFTLTVGKKNRFRLIVGESGIQ